MTKNVQRRYLGTEPEQPKPPEASPTPPAQKMLTEEEVNKIVQKRLNDESKKVAAERADLLSRIAKLEPDAQKAAELQAQVEKLEREGKTKAELEEMDRKKERATLEARAKVAEEQRDKLKQSYEHGQLERDLMEAAAHKDADALDPQQLVILLKANGARTVPKLVDGKLTDLVETKVRYTAVKDGKNIELDLTPAEAIKVLRDEGKYPNQFKANIAGGLGGIQGNRTVAGVNPGTKLAMTQAEFNKAYAKGTLPKADR